MSQDDDLISDIASATSLDWLMRVVATQQQSYWYSPEGKSGSDFEDQLTKVSMVAIRRAQDILGLG